MTETKILRWNPTKGIGQMARRASYTPYKVAVVGDVFAASFAQVDFVFAVIASRGGWEFVIRTARPRQYERWLRSVAKRGVNAGARYEARMKAHFRRYKEKFTEGYSLPSRPTDELRAIYDSAARTQGRPRKPCGTRLHAGFSLLEYHWRSWPLGNVRVVVE
ncbi:MAG: hypothetical protein HQ581_22360 [Planctomycetes bacterium]|nr:hypothetical protein [Planctomycetota bacterium]